ncbi:hypothetical protein [Chromobacterium amazonense]|uniref:hypothetical protein n=1 Tax=Chromobacterium amazonense TaxID=1382803 RepID=UPI0011145B9C|nr:hypothetical protein [Chromobacterium amazonense]
MKVLFLWALRWLPCRNLALAAEGWVHGEMQRVALWQSAFHVLTVRKRLLQEKMLSELLEVISRCARQDDVLLL